ncbi:hypothetical protein [Neomegalonema sp.]|uniref:hypothetical protein n=1 Tax=Neomegalonema sp. TaxID=2039713 RepID=UPI002605CC74|nr:hypothetical protein [Neomegalonema sp.]MDD2869636.1 hypothetical protein [Neomegalonema sp.]
MKLKVIQWNAEHSYHECIDETGETRKIDLCVDSVSVDKPSGEFDPVKLVGKTVEVDRVYPFIEIAENVREAE